MVLQLSPSSLQSDVVFFDHLRHQKPTNNNQMMPGTEISPRAVLLGVTKVFSERYVENAPLLKSFFDLSVCVSVTHLSCE